MEFSSTYKKFPSSKTSNIAATYLKFRDKQGHFSPLIFIKFQICSCNIADFRTGEFLVCTGEFHYKIDELRFSLSNFNTQIVIKVII